MHKHTARPTVPPGRNQGPPCGKRREEPMIPGRCPAVMHAWLLLGSGVPLPHRSGASARMGGLGDHWPRINVFWAALSQIRLTGPFWAEADAYPTEHG